ncbi:type III pantothenate kinase [Heliobacterium undosum]|uniref:Type III pantothenate kinase n=1 Tax=Heliomicrobium undosum TaxID=121734 RepID=A0A845KXN1_9FIRM|nr:type III pantothenate kinase [Heliomicrobium undosum]MZP28382.1 type III pantothenate kinase [Heliomicrobium undosum]
MLLVLDIGNTNIVCAVFDDDEQRAFWRLATDRRKTVDEYRILMLEAMEAKQIATGDIDRVAISSVVPPVNPILVKMFRDYWGLQPLLVQPGIKTGLNIKIDDPRALGPDRIVNAVAAYHIYGGPVIIVDLGTATTVCAVNEKGDFLGGVICPGIGISVEALVAHAAKLPRVEINEPEQAIGKNTVAGMQSGIYYGYVGMVDGLVRRFKNEMGESSDSPVKVVATGGFGELIGRGCATVDHIHPSLTLEGLRLLYERNRPAALSRRANTPR